jgi:hypothetical protein
LLYTFFVVLACITVGLTEVPDQFSSDFGFVVLGFGLFFLGIDGMILGIGIWGSLYIDRINDHPPKHFSQQQAIQRLKVLDKLRFLIPGSACLFGAAGVVFMVFTCGSNNCAVSLLAFIFTTMILFGVILSDLGNQYRVYLRKRSAPTVGEILSGDQQPVLYLRSFIDDDWAEQLVTSDATEEDEICQAFQPFGPLIAIGQPGERLPDLGAARAYFEDDEWQAAIQHYMDIASLVVLRAGFSQGLLWEIQHAVQHLNPQRLVLLIRLKRKEYDRFREQVGEYFPKGLPDHTQYEVRKYEKDNKSIFWRFSTLLGVIHFDTDWTPHFEAFKEGDFIISGSRRVFGMIRSALHPVYDKLGRNWPADPKEISTRQKIKSYGCIVLVLGAAYLLIVITRFIGNLIGC